MATMLFSIGGMGIGGALGGPAGAMGGAMLGAMAGGALDTWLVPTIFPPKAVRYGRITDFQFQGVNEGGPVHYLIGPENRIAGQLIWMTDLIEEVKSHNAGGGGKGPSAKVTKYSYFVHMAVAICEGPIIRVEKIWADGKMLYSNTPVLDLTSNQIAARLIIIGKDDLSILGRMLAHAERRIHLDLVIPNAVYGTSTFRVGEVVDISGFATSDNNGLFKISAINEEAGSYTILRLALQQADAIGVQTEPSGQNVTISRVQVVRDLSKFEDIAVYAGTPTQTVDPWIEAIEGAGNVPSYRNIAYVVFKKLSLESYGNRIPQLNFQVVAQETITVADAVSQILTRGGFTAGDFDVSAIAGVGNLRGYTISGPMTVREALEPIMIAHNLIVHESNGKIVFRPRTGAIDVTVAADDLAAHEEGTDIPRSVTIREVSEYDMPSEVNVQYVDADNDYQRGSQRARKSDALVENVVSLDLPFVMEAVDAKNIANRLLYDGWANRQLMEFSLPPSYLEAEESDLVQLPAYGQDFSVRLTEISRGYNGIINAQGVVEDVSEHDLAADAGAEYVQDVGIASASELELIDLSSLRDRDSETPGIYYAAGTSDVAGKWRGAAVFVSRDNESWKELEPVLAQATLGETVLGEDQYSYIVDNDTPGQTWSIGGPPGWQVSSAWEPYGGTCRVIAAGGGGIYGWTQALATSGDYRVYARWTPGTDRSTTAFYRVYHDGGWDDIYVDQSNPFFTGQWVDLGAYTFTSEVAVRLYQTQNGTTSADAIRIESEHATVAIADGPVGYWDRANTVRVRLRSGTLQSRTEREVLDGYNWALVGSEVIAFQTATLVETGVYDLSVLLRGMRDTERMVPLHGPRERFVLLDAPTLTFLPINKEEIGEKRYFKCAAPGEILDNILPQEVVLRGNTMRPFSPAQLRARAYESPVSGPGILFSWVPRSRKIVRVLDLEDWGVPIMDLDGWRAAVYDSDGRWRRNFVSLGLSASYSTTSQIADGIGVGEQITFEVYQVSNRFGPGNAASITVTSTV